MTVNEPPNEPRARPTFSRVVLVLVTAASFTVLLLLLGVDFALMWGILTFFSSFVPYIGLAAPTVLLALLKTLFVAVMLYTFPETRWLANFMGMRPPEAKTGPSP